MDKLEEIYTDTKHDIPTLSRQIRNNIQTILFADFIFLKVKELNRPVSKSPGSDNLNNRLGTNNHT